MLGVFDSFLASTFQITNGINWQLVALTACQAFCFPLPSLSRVERESQQATERYVLFSTFQNIMNKQFQFQFAFLLN